MRLCGGGHAVQRATEQLTHQHVDLREQTAEVGFMGRVCLAPESI